MAKKLLALGGGCVDMLVKPMDSLNFEIDSNSIDSFVMSSGGDTMNAAIDAHTLGMDVDFLTCVGNDVFGDFMRDRLDEVGIGNKRVIVKDDVTRVSLVLINSDGDRSFFGVPGGAQGTLCLDDIDFDCFGEYDFLLHNSVFAFPHLLDENMKKVFEEGKKHGLTTITDMVWDRTGKWFEHVKDAAPYIDYFLPSILEAREMSGLEDPEEMAEFFLNAGVKNVAIKLGGDGSYFANKDEKFYTGSYKVDIVDTTGAGDAFVGGFTTALMMGLSNREAAQFASATGSYACTFIGTTTQAPTYDQIVKFMKETEQRPPKKTL